MGDLEVLNPHQVVYVLRLFGDAECHDCLIWHSAPGGLIIAARCSDTFAYATADAETITPQDLGLLKHAAEVLDMFDARYHLPEYFAALKRQQRPLSAYTERIEEVPVRKLFWALPDRTVKSKQSTERGSSADLDDPEGT